MGPRKGEGNPLPHGPGCLVPPSPFLGQTSVLSSLNQSHRGQKTWGSRSGRGIPLTKPWPFLTPGSFLLTLSPTEFSLCEAAVPGPETHTLELMSPQEQVTAAQEGQEADPVGSFCSFVLLWSAPPPAILLGVPNYGCPIPASDSLWKLLSTICRVCDCLLATVTERSI